jgi:hypothetical protein
MTNMPDRTLTDEEWKTVRKTLDVLQEAQHLTEHARQALCPVPGFSDEWSELAVAWEAVKKGWHLVETRRMQIYQHENTGLESTQDSTNPISVYTPVSG